MRKRVWAALVLVAVGSAATAAPARVAVRRARPARVPPKAARPAKASKQAPKKTGVADLPASPLAAGPPPRAARVPALREAADWSDALQQFRMALQIGAAEQPPARRDGRYLCGRARASAAVHAYQTALRLSPRDTSIHERLGITYQRMDMPHLAASVYKNVIWIDARDSSAHSHLGWALERQGKRQEAILAYQRALQLQPDNLIARARLSRLQPISPQFAGVAPRGGVRRVRPS